jgi:RNA-directed DNA polymerase
MHENRETSVLPDSGSGRSAKAECRTADMDGAEESDSGVVPMKHPNKGERGSPAEGAEGRPGTKENAIQHHTVPTQSGVAVFQVLHGVRERARKNHQERFTALLHHLTITLLRDSFYALQRRAAPGVDGVRWQEYEERLEERLAALHSRIHRGAYRAQPSRRVYIPKADGRQRPLGIAALEDKIVQQAVVTILNQVYEVDFRGFSYGFRPGHSPHQALDALNVGIQRRRVNWILDADIRGFFDNLSHEWMLKFIQHRVANRRILRLIQKWLKAGVSEDGDWSETKMGTPQGAVVSPLLANVYLHYVFDLWMEAWRKKQAQGDVIVVRYADDLVVGFEHLADAERFLVEFRERLAKFGLELHPEKTRLIEFGRYAEANRARRGEGKPETFVFLGFTHHCAHNPKTGIFVIQRRTAKKRMQAKLHQIKQTLRQRMHDPPWLVAEWLKSVLLGYYGYHAVPGNLAALSNFREQIRRMWRALLSRRSQRGRVVWERFDARFGKFFPHPRILHPFPATSVQRQISEVGAVCVSSARTDLCGGRPAMAVPTATPKNSVLQRAGGR